jgi:tetratricopeptide (TPR) repeat protein
MTQPTDLPAVAPAAAEAAAAPAPAAAPAQGEAASPADPGPPAPAEDSTAPAGEARPAPAPDTAALQPDQEQHDLVGEGPGPDSFVDGARAPAARRRTWPARPSLACQPGLDAGQAATDDELYAVHVDDPRLDGPEAQAELVRWLHDPRPAPWAITGPAGSGRSHLGRMIMWHASHLGLPAPALVELGDDGEVDEALRRHLLSRIEPVVVIAPEHTDTQALGLPAEHKVLSPSAWTPARARRLLSLTCAALGQPGPALWEERWPGAFDALHHLLGWQPRTTQALIAALLRCRPEASPARVLDLHLRAQSGALRTLLRHTAGQPRTILEALAGPRAMTAGELAQETALDVNSVSSQLHRLRQAGLLRREPLGKGASAHHIADRAQAAALAVERPGAPLTELHDTFTLMHLLELPARGAAEAATTPLRRRLLDRVRPVGLAAALPPALSWLGRPDTAAAAMPRPTRLRALRGLAEAIRDMPGAWPAGWDNRAAWEAVGGAWIRLARKEELVRELAVADAPARARLLHALRALSDALTLLHGEDAVRAIGTALRSGDLAHAADAGNAAAAAERLGAPALARAVALNAAAGWPEPPPLRTLFDQLAHGEAEAGSWLLWTAIAVPPGLSDLRVEGARRAWAAAGPSPAFAAAYLALALPAEAPLSGVEPQLNALLDADPDNVAALSLLGELRWREGDRARAERSFLAATEKLETTPAPGEAAARVREAALAVLGRSAEALGVSLTLSSAWAWPYARLAELCAGAPGRSDEARRYARRALTLHPDSIAPRLILAGAAPDEAPRWLEPLRTIAEASFLPTICPPGAAPAPAPAIAVGLEALSARRPEDDHLRAMLPHVDPRRAPGEGAHPFLRLARALNQPPDREAAASLVRERPEDPLLWVLLAQVQERLGEDPDASWRRAAALDPDERLALAGLAAALQRRRGERLVGPVAQAALDAEIHALHARLAAIGPAGPAGRVEAAGRAASQGMRAAAAVECLDLIEDGGVELQARADALDLLRRLLREAGALDLRAALDARPGRHLALRAAVHRAAGLPAPGPLAPEVQAVVERLLA